jgi:hypothetical protein
MRGSIFCQETNRPVVPRGGKRWCAVVVSAMVALPPGKTAEGFGADRDDRLLGAVTKSAQAIRKRCGQNRPVCA